MLIVDPLDEKGHENFNRLFLDLLGESHTLLVSSSSNYRGGALSNTRLFSSRLINKRFRFFYLLGQIIIIFRTLNFAIVNKEKCVVFLCYDLFALVFLSHFFYLFNIRLYLIEHNTFVPSSKVKSTLFNLINKAAKHITLAPYIGSKIQRRKKKVISIWHPIKKIEFNSDNLLGVTLDKQKKILFMPSSTISEKSKMEINNSIKCIEDVILIRKGNGFSEESNVIEQQYFEHYENIILRANGILIPQKFDYRVSGVFFEALNSSATIYMSNCAFSREMESCFGTKVKIVCDWSQFVVTEKCGKVIDADLWNNKIARILKNEVY